MRLLVEEQPVAAFSIVISIFWSKGFTQIVSSIVVNLNESRYATRSPHENSILNHVRCILMMEQLESSRNIGTVAWNTVNQCQTFL